MSRTKMWPLDRVHHHKVRIKMKREQQANEMNSTTQKIRAHKTYFMHLIEMFVNSYHLLCPDTLCNIFLATELVRRNRVLDIHFLGFCIGREPQFVVVLLPIIKENRKIVSKST